MTARTALPALPDDVPAEVLPLLTPATWRATVAAAEYRCQCAGTCGRNHRKDGDRCAKSLRGLGATRLFALPVSPGSRTSVALCGPCADGRQSAERRAANQAVATRLAEVPSLFDLISKEA